MTKPNEVIPRRIQLTMSETELQKNVLDLAKLNGWLAYHTYDSRRSNPGFPDLVLVHPVRRKTLFRELKSDSGRVSTDQEAWLQALQMAGNDTGLWYPSDWRDGTILKQLTVKRGDHASPRR